MHYLHSVCTHGEHLKATIIKMFWKFWTVVIGDEYSQKRH